MSTWLKLLPLELAGISKDDIIEPEYELEKDDQVVGDMSHISRQLFTLAKLLEKDARQCDLDSNYCADKAKKLELEAKTVEFLAKSQAIKEIMWIGLRDEFGIWGKNIGIRTGSKVVIMEGDANDNIPPTLRGLFRL